MVKLFHLDDTCLMDDINATQKLSEEVLKTDKISYDEVSTFEEKQVDECEDTFAKLDDEDEVTFNATEAVQEAFDNETNQPRQKWRT